MRVVVEPKGRGGFSFWAVLLELLPAAVVMALLSLVGIAHVTSRVLVVNMGYELSGLQSRLTELERQNSELSVELTTLKSPVRLESWAKGNGLGPPQATAVIHPKR